MDAIECTIREMTSEERKSRRKSIQTGNSEKTTVILVYGTKSIMLIANNPAVAGVDRYKNSLRSHLVDIQDGLEDLLVDDVHLAEDPHLHLLPQHHQQSDSRHRNLGPGDLLVRWGLVLVLGVVPALVAQVRDRMLPQHLSNHKTCMGSQVKSQHEVQHSRQDRYHLLQSDHPGP